jgi:hypothetical protein
MSQVLDVQWSKGGGAKLVAFDGEMIVLMSTIPSPPGSRLEGTFGTMTLRVKVHQSKRQSDGATFELRGRAFDFVRETRDALIAHVQARQTSQGP